MQKLKTVSLDTYARTTKLEITDEIKKDCTTNDAITQ